MPEQSTNIDEALDVILDRLFPDTYPLDSTPPDIQDILAHEGSVGAQGELRSMGTAVRVTAADDIMFGEVSIEIPSIATSSTQTEERAEGAPIQVYKQEDYDVFIGAPGELTLAKITDFDSVLVDGNYLSFWACDHVITLVDDSTVKLVHKTRQEEHVFVVAASESTGNWQSTSVNRFKIKEGR